MKANEYATPPTTHHTRKSAIDPVAATAAMSESPASERIAPTHTAMCAGTRASSSAVTPIASDDTPSSAPTTIMSLVCANWRTIRAPSDRKIAPTQ